MYAYDLFSNEYLLENFKINSSSSNKFFNNVLIIKNEQYLEAINILNGKTFWLIESDLHRDSKILNIKNVDGDLNIFMDDGKIAIIKEGIITEILDLKLKKLNSYYFINDKIITIQKNGKIVVF